MTHQPARFCARLLNLTGTITPAGDNRAEPFLTMSRSEQFRSAILFSLGDDETRDEHFFSLFQVL